MAAGVSNPTTADLSISGGGLSSAVTTSLSGSFTSIPSQPGTILVMLPSVHQPTQIIPSLQFLVQLLTHGLILELVPFPDQAQREL